MKKKDIIFLKSLAGQIEFQGYPLQAKKMVVIIEKENKWRKEQQSLTEKLNKELRKTLKLIRQHKIKER